jgi:hypothetical protein
MPLSRIDPCDVAVTTLAAKQCGRLGHHHKRNRGTRTRDLRRWPTLAAIVVLIVSTTDTRVCWDEVTRAWLVTAQDCLEDIGGAV